MNPMPALPVPSPRTARRRRWPSGIHLLPALLALLLVGGGLRAHAAAGPARAGLWVGEVTLRKATTLGVSGDPTPTADTASFRILLHVSGDGTTRLLKDATVATVASGNTPRTVLATDDTASALRPITFQGRPMIQRYGTVAYDWDGTGEEAHTKTMTGQLVPSGTCTVTITCGAEHPTNPFRHRHHPDHRKGIRLERTLKITLPPADPAALEHDGVLAFSGTYEETVKGILPASADPILVRGDITLRRVNDIATLDDLPKS